ncbi:hypothetical protein MMC06_003362 [Schaereria dolodes]|nr:hypothetical protein [Schaereria dolodes]
MAASAALSTGKGSHGTTEARGNLHILVAAIPIFGHFEKLAVIAADLVRRNYKVSFLTGTRFQEKVEKLGAHFVPLQGVADYAVFNGPDLNAQWPERAKIPPGPGILLHDLSHVFFEQIPEQFVAVQRFLLSSLISKETIVIIQDTGFQGTLPPLLGAPGLKPAALITVGITSLTLNSIDTAPFGTGLPPDNSPEGRIRNAAMVEGMRNFFSKPIADWIRKMEEVGATDPPGNFVDQWVTLPDRYLQMCIEELEYPRSDLPANLRYIGALPTGERESLPFPPWWNVVERHEKTTIVVSQGTAANDPEELIIPTLKALKDLDVIVVATLVRSDHLDNFEVPSNALIARFIPFDDLFKHVDLIVNNGGYGTIQQALSAGVPMVLAGLSEDKMEGTAHAAWTGAAINLRTQRPEVAQVREAVEKVLGSLMYKEKAMYLKEKYAKADCLGDVAATIDELAAPALTNSKPKIGKE